MFQVAVLLATICAANAMLPISSLNDPTPCMLVQEADQLVTKVEQLCPNNTKTSDWEHICPKVDTISNKFCDIGKFAMTPKCLGVKTLNGLCDFSTHIESHSKYAVDPSELCPYLPMLDGILTEIINTYCQ